MQSLFWLIAGISAAPFALGGEVSMGVLAAVTMLLALGTVLLGIGVLWRRRRARGWAIGLEVVCLVGTVLLFALPIGANRGLVSVMVNVALPVENITVMSKRRREAYS